MHKTGSSSGLSVTLRQAGLEMSHREAVLLRHHANCPYLPPEQKCSKGYSARVTAATPGHRQHTVVSSCLTHAESRPEWVEPLMPQIKMVLNLIAHVISLPEPQTHIKHL